MYDVTIIGAGRVGLPLALMLEDKKLNIAIKDKDIDIARTLIARKMPFFEPGFDEMIRNTNIHPYIHEMPESKAYIITVGTPLAQHIESDLNQVIEVIDELIKKIKLEDKLIILRSTVAPSTTKFVGDYIAQKTNLKLGENFFLAMCPERIAEGKAFEELAQLPQIIGAEDDQSFEKTKEIFSKMIPENKIFRGTFSEAELAKLFTNIYRYINFSIPNYFVIMAQHFGADVFHIFDIMNHGYERNIGLKQPGFTGGSCLRKDFGMISEHLPQTDLILQAYKINEYMPKYVVDLVKDKIKNSTVGILGYTFKADVDDVRDTLSAKLIRYVKRNVPERVIVSDYNLPKGEFIDPCNNIKFDNVSTLELINMSDIIFIATNHSQYYKIDRDNFAGKTVVDLWRVLGKQMVVNF